MNIKLLEQEYGYNGRTLNRLYQLIDNILNDYAKILVIRVDLYSRKNHQEDVDREYLIQAFQRLRNNMRSNNLISKGYIAYVATLEQTENRGWHYHVAFFFDASLRQEEFSIGLQIVRYWEEVITKQFGYGNVTSGMKYEQEGRNGTGVVHWQDTHKINRVKEALAYLVKEDYNTVNHVYTNSIGYNQRSFFCSQYKPKAGNRGRPRSIRLIDESNML